MVLKQAEKDKVRALLVEAITVLCKNGLGYKRELCVEGLLGITLDKEDVFLVNIQQTFATSDAEVSEADSDEGQSTEPGKRKRRRRKVSGKKRTMSDRSDDRESADESYSADASNRLSESGGEPREKRQAVDGSEVLTEVKQEPEDIDSDDEDLVFVKSDPGDGGFEGGGGDRQYSMSSTMPNLSSNIPLNYEGPGCSSWDNSTSSLDASGQMMQGDTSLQQGDSSNVLVPPHRPFLSRMQPMRSIEGTPDHPTLTSGTQRLRDNNQFVMPSPGDITNNDDNKRRKRYQCQECGIEVWRPSELVRHQRTHTGEKPFQCDICGSSFALKSTMKTHKKQHIK